MRGKGEAVKTLSLKRDPSSPPLAPVRPASGESSYPLMRPYYLYWNTNANMPLVTEFVDITATVKTNVNNITEHHCSCLQPINGTIRNPSGAGNRSATGAPDQTPPKWQVRCIIPDTDGKSSPCPSLPTRNSANLPLQTVQEGKGDLSWSTAKETACHFQAIGCPPTLTCFAQLPTTRLETLVGMGT